MKQTLTLAFLVTTTVLALSSAHAQDVCSQSREGELRSCVTDAVSSCVSATNVCTKDTSVVTIDDVRNEAIRACCRPKLNRGKRNACFNTQKRRYQVGRTSRSLSRFVRTARSEIDRIRKSNCFNGAYNNLF